MSIPISVPRGKNSLPSCARVPLAKCFEEHNAGGHGNIEGFYRAGGWQRNNEIAPLARQLMQAWAFAAEHDPHRRGVIHFGVILVPLLIEAHTPIARFLQLLHRADEIEH